MEKETSATPEPQRDEVLALLELIHREILNGASSKRKLERDLGLGQGYIGSLLRGRIMLKVEHLWVLGEALGFEPLVLFFQAAPKEHRERFLEELGLRSEDGGASAAAAAAEPMTREEIEDLVRRIVRQELARMATS